ncbi:tail fiber protein [Pseudomonas lalucatii]|uniref:Tail fiber protein n=1 Tax=Pseudomonas lalucatii TaxID=1424203 RepID=A0ABS5PXG2_9PSED|nr:tail fiber protein [Pseudomonas lalucatii]MBS7660554.1 tail fiber protein [Pseudomonas lalucatii]
MALQITITNAGRAEIINANNTGTGPVVITAVGFGTGQYSPAKTQTALQAEVKRVSTIAGQAVADDTIHVVAKDEGPDAYNVGEFGLFSASGTLVAVYSQPAGAGWIIQKAGASTLLLATDIILESLDASSLTFGDILFINPPATTTTPGVVELADAQETQDGLDGTRAVTPAGLKTLTANTSRAGLVQLDNSLASTSTSKALTAAQGKKLQDEKEPAFAAGTTAQYRRGDKTWQDLAAAVRAVLMTGLSTATATAVAATDSLLTAIGKLQAQITGLNNTKLDATANAVSASKLATARTIGGVSFDGTANINLPGVNATGNQNTTGNAGTATKLATARTINGVSFDGSGNIVVEDATKLAKAGDRMTGALAHEVIAGGGGILSIDYPDGADYQESGAVNGTIKITLPKSWSNTMMRLRIAVYDYTDGYGAAELLVSGYTPTANSAWYYTSAQAVGLHKFGATVRFGHDGTNCCILLGTTGTAHSYPKVVVENMLAMYSGVDDTWRSGWSISRITSEAGITVTAAGTERFNENSQADRLLWKEYGPNHCIFDASDSTAPDGSAISNTDPAQPWQALHPTLMGWNGSQTYGVRVDIARYAERLKTVRTINGVAFDGTSNITVADATKLPTAGGTMDGSIVYEADNYGSGWARGFNITDGGATVAGMGGYGGAGTFIQAYFALGATPYLNGTGFRLSPGTITTEGEMVLGGSKVRPISTKLSGGAYGYYDSTKIGHVWSMGTQYAIPDDGANFGNIYGMAYKHTANPTGGTMAGGHQLVVCSNGVPGVALGMAGGIWTSGLTETAALKVNGQTTLLNGTLLDGTTNGLKITNGANGTIEIGNRNTSYTHYGSSTGNHYFYGNVTVQTNIAASGTITASGGFSGGGGSITGLNANNLASGTVPEARLLGVYAGEVAYFAMAAPPTGWLKANGAAVSRSTYAALFAAIGTTYGAGNGSTTFNLPDLRGEFIRGWDDGRGVDGGRALGSAQAALAPDIPRDGWGTTGSAPQPSVSVLAGRLVVGSGGGEIAETLESLRAAGNNVTPSAGDNRPRNIALLACIKY